MKRLYRDIALARLRAFPFSTDDVVDTQMVGSYESRPTQYIVLFTFNEPTEADRLTGPSLDHDIRYITWSVGKTVDDAMAAADHVAAMFMNWRPELEGRSARPFRHVSADPIRRDPDVGSGLYFYEDEWSLYTTPGR